MAPANSKSEEWETVAEARTKVLFDADGDSLTGTWEGFETVLDPNTGEEYVYANLRNERGALTTSAGYQLMRGLRDVEVGRTVRLTRTGQSDMGKGKNPMTNFTIQVRKA